MINIVAQEIFTENQYQQHPLGALGVDKYGRRFRYVQAGGSALVTGHLLQEPAEDTAFRSMAVAVAAAIGADEVEVTLGGTATTANQFDDGQALVESSTGIGQLFGLKSVEAVSASGQATLKLDRPLKIALTTSSQISIRKSSYDGVIDMPTTHTGRPVGVALYAMTASYFGWIVSGGDAACLFDTGTNTSDSVTGVEPSSAVAGSVMPSAGTAGDIVIGHAREIVSVDSTMGFVNLIID